MQNASASAGWHSRPLHTSPPSRSGFRGRSGGHGADALHGGARALNGDLDVGFGGEAAKAEAHRLEGGVAGQAQAVSTSDGSIDPALQALPVDTATGSMLDMTASASAPSKWMLTVWGRSYHF